MKKQASIDAHNLFVGDNKLGEEQDASEGILNTIDLPDGDFSEQINMFDDTLLNLGGDVQEHKDCVMGYWGYMLLS